MEGVFVIFEATDGKVETLNRETNNTSGLGKSAAWKNLAEALSTPTMDTLIIWQLVDPKAVSSDELCGWENLKTKGWCGGVLGARAGVCVHNCIKLRFRTYIVLYLR